MKVRLILATVFCSLTVALHAQAQAGTIPFAFSLDVNAEYRWAPSGELLVEADTPYKSGVDLVRNYVDRTPFARMSLAYGGAEGLSVALDAVIRRDLTGSDPWYDAVNLPFDTSPSFAILMDSYMLARGVAYWRSPALSVAFGRDTVDYGGILYGSLLPSTRLPYLDSLRARGTLGMFTVDWMVATIPAVKSWDGLDVYPNEGVSGTEPQYNWMGLESQTTIAEVLNRYSWNWHTFVLGLTDHAMIARRNNSFLLTDFFPITSRHQTSDLQTNNSLILDLSWRPLPDLIIAVQGGLDDFNANTVGISDTGTPTIPAIVGGARYQGTTRLGSLVLNAETGYTHQLWGNYDGSQITPWDVNPFLRMQYRFSSDHGGLLLPLTSPYGPGAAWGRASLTQEIRALDMSVGAELLVLEKNEGANLITYSNDPVNGPYVFFCQLALPVAMMLPSWEVRVTPALLLRNTELRFEATFMAAYHLRTGDTTGAAPRSWAAPFGN
jgi:hypothetical protein